MVAKAVGRRPVIRTTHQGRDPSLDGVAQAELTEVVVAPGPQGAVLHESQAVAHAGRDGCPVLGAPDLGRAVSVSVVAKAEVAVGVGAKCPQSAGLLERQREVTATRGRRPVRVVTDLGRGPSPVGVAHAESAVPVGSPGPKGAALPHGEAVLVAGEDGRPVVGVADPGRGPSVDAGDETWSWSLYPAAAKAEVATPIAVVAPGPEGAVLLQGKAVGIAAGDGHPVVRLADLPGGGVRGEVQVALAELTVVVQAPSPEGAILLQGQGVVGGGGHGRPLPCSDCRARRRCETRRRRGARRRLGRGHLLRTAGQQKHASKQD